jgi:hypothetical protein
VGPEIPSLVEASESAVHASLIMHLDNSIACLCPPAHARRLQDSKDTLAVDNPPAAVSPPRQHTAATSTSRLVSKSNPLPFHATAANPCKAALNTQVSTHSQTHRDYNERLSDHRPLLMSLLASSECRAPRAGTDGEEPAAWTQRPVLSPCYGSLPSSAVFALWTESELV